MLKALVAVCFNQRVQSDLFYLFDKLWCFIIDECTRYRLATQLESKSQKHLHQCYLQTWIRYFGPMKTLVVDQEGGLTGDLTSRFCDRYNIERQFAGTDAHTTTAIAERGIAITKLCALKLKADCTKQGLDVEDHEIVYEATMAANHTIVHGQCTPVQALLGYTPKDLVTDDPTTLEARLSILEGTPDPSETAIRLRMQAKQNIVQSIVEDRIARAVHTKTQQVPKANLEVPQQLISGEPQSAKIRVAGVDHVSWFIWFRIRVWGL